MFKKLALCALLAVSCAFGSLGIANANSAPASSDEISPNLIKIKKTVNLRPGDEYYVGYPSFLVYNENNAIQLSFGLVTGNRGGEALVRAYTEEGIEYEYLFYVKSY